MYRLVLRCVSKCLKEYGRDVGWKAAAILAGCIVAAAVLGDFTGISIAKCLAATGIGDATMGLAICISSCIREGREPEA
jgi:hypothetical protein